MRYMLMHKLDDSNAAQWQATPEVIAAVGEYMEEVSKAGVLLAAEGLLPSSGGAAVITKKDGQTIVVDGPFAEAKEVIGGFAILQVRDQAEAVEWATRFAALFDHDIEVEVRRVAEFE
ncbi:YciI family protein [Dactylosporangium sp. NPDC051484]|uniref:YciI family protein n=1 Tax=Dactylosporangium sp. NPDC051484 TaxID=3154942 RepID=UPI00344C2869